MVLVDTSVWIAHFRKSDSKLKHLLMNADVACHDFIIGELACGHLKDRDEIIILLKSLPRTEKAEHIEILHFIDSHQLMGLGLGLVDIHILASAVLSRTPLWTLDKNLQKVSRKLDVFHK